MKIDGGSGAGGRLDGQRGERIVAIVQARMGSSRLPGKVLEKIGDKPMIAHVVDRLRRSRQLHEVRIATSIDASDDAVAEWCAANGVPCTRGSLHDVLERYRQAAADAAASDVVRVTGDCPLVDPAVVDQLIDAYLATDVDYAANRLPEHRTYPIGLDAEVFPRLVLEQMACEATEKYQREHVTPLLYDPTSRFRVLHVVSESTDAGEERWTVDTPEDLTFMRRLFELYPGAGEATWRQLLEVVEESPELRALNAGVEQKSHREVDERS